MNIEYIREFLILTETQNFWDAAEKLYIGQSTLSKHIRSMEQELGVSLFDRTRRSVNISTYGKLFLPRAKEIVESYYKAKAVLESEKDNTNGRFVFGGIPVLTQYKITALLYDYFKNYANSSVLIYDRDSKTLKEDLKQDRCEVIFIRQLPGESFDEHLVYIPYWEDELVVMLPKTHPLASEKKLELKQMEKEDFLLIGEENDLKDMIIRECVMHGFHPRISLDFNRLSVLLEMITLGKGISIVPEGYLNLSDSPILPPEPPFRICRLKPGIKTTMCFCYRKDGKLSKLAERFIDLIMSRIDGALR